MAAGDVGQGANAVALVPAARRLGADLDHLAAKFMSHDGACFQRRHSARAIGDSGKMQVGAADAAILYFDQQIRGQWLWRLDIPNDQRLARCLE